jgi:hypothetical protein
MLSLGAWRPAIRPRELERDQENVRTPIIALIKPLQSPVNRSRLCLLSTRGSPAAPLRLCVMTRGTSPMKKLALATAAVLALLSIAGCSQTGKGKAPPPVVTKG